MLVSPHSEQLQLVNKKASINQYVLNDIYIFVHILRNKGNMCKCAKFSTCVGSEVLLLTVACLYRQAKKSQLLH
jgi:hypothetical protein